MIAEVKSLTAVTADGVSLSLRHFRAVGTARSVLLCTHAMMANGRYMHRFAEYLASRGVEVYVLDWRGHGLSVPPSPRRDRWCFDDYVEFDLPAALGEVSRCSGVGLAEIAYLGHSLGGLVGLAGFGAGALPSPRRLLLIATSVWLPGPRGSIVRRAAMGFYGAIATPLGYAPIRRMGLGTDDEPGDYVAQLTSWAASGRWCSRTGVDYSAALGEIRCQTLAVVGAGDRLCRRRDAEQLTSRLPASCPLRMVGRDFGDAIDPDHFTLFTDVALKLLWTDLARALDA